MSADLLAEAVAAHGGLDRWNRYASVRADVAIGGALWVVRGQPGVLADVTVEARLREQRVTIHLNGRGRRYSFVPGRVAVEDEGGRVVSERSDPRDAFRGHTATTPWDDLHLAYFNGYALWTYLTIPFLYSNWAVPGAAIPLRRHFSPRAEAVAPVWHRPRVGRGFGPPRGAMDIRDHRGPPPGRRGGVNPR